MNREEIERIAEEAALNARKSRKGPSIDQIRKILNVIFLICAIAGLIIYFAYPDKRLVGMGTIGIGMFFKIIEFFLRFLF
jgi:hypothetical protein